MASANELDGGAWKLSLMSVCPSAGTVGCIIYSAYAVYSIPGIQCIVYSVYSVYYTPNTMQCMANFVNPNLGDN